MKVLYMAKPGDVDPWYQDFTAALGDEFEVVKRAPGRPFAPQVQGARSRCPRGSSSCTRYGPAAGEAGARLWQLILEGYDQLDLDLFRANGIPAANTPGQFSSRALAGHTLMLMLCAVKGFTKSQRDLEVGVFGPLLRR